MSLFLAGMLSLVMAQLQPPANQDEIPAADQALVGEWKGTLEIDAAELRKNAALQNLTDKQFAGIQVMLGLVAAGKKQTFTFAADGSATNALKTLNTQESKAGRWKVSKREPEKKLVTVEITYEEGEPKTSTLVFKQMNEKTMELVIGGEAIQAGGFGNLTRGIKHVFRKAEKHD